MKYRYCLFLVGLFSIVLSTSGCARGPRFHGPFYRTPTAEVLNKADAKRVTVAQEKEALTPKVSFEAQNRSV